jgi:hypothetical protein
MNWLVMVNMESSIHGMKPKPKTTWYNIFYTDTTFKKIIIVFVIALPMFIAINYFNTYQHELTHKQIDIYSGCNKTHTVVTIFGGGYSECLDYENVTINSDLRFMLHSQNEIIGYNINTIILTLALCTLCISFILIILFKTMEKKQ